MDSIKDFLGQELYDALVSWLLQKKADKPDNNNQQEIDMNMNSINNPAAVSYTTNENNGDDNSSQHGANPGTDFDVTAEENNSGYGTFETAASLGGDVDTAWDYDRENTIDELLNTMEPKDYDLVKMILLTLDDGTVDLKATAENLKARAGYLFKTTVKRGNYAPRGGVSAPAYSDMSDNEYYRMIRKKN